MTKNVKRLFAQFQPTKYDLELNLDEQALTFHGAVLVDGHKSGRPSQRLTLHQNGLKITKAELTYHGKKSTQVIEIERINNHNSFHEVRLHAKQMLYPGRYIIKLEFAGKITPQMHGLYPCYFTHKGKEKKLLATQFESHHAREVFPCIDEPEAKATFDLTLTHTLGDQVLANTPVLSQYTKGNRKTTTFETTPIMSTYLLAFVAGDIHGVSTKTSDGIVVNTWGTVAQPKSSLEFANKEAERVLEFFADYFQTSFPLKKLDQIALPDFESGAMENWGLVTYREIALLTDAKNRSLTSEQYVAMVVAHEVSHQWFGNLVTMKWWDDLWLNESFASLMEHIALDSLHPDWNQWETFASSDVISCSNRDIFKDVQPVRVDVKHPDEIGTLFDPAIVYAKGGRLLKMLREYIGDKAFRKGLKTYFDANAYKNTTRDDLWKALSKASGQNIHAFMDPWLEQSGMPVVSLRAEKNKVIAIQQRFVLDKPNDKTRWPIPLLADKVLPTMFDQPSVVISEYPKPLILNQRGSGHYIVNYGSGELKDSVDDAFAKRTMASEGRINYLNDLLLLARRGDISTDEVLEVVAKSSTEPRDAVWALMGRAVGTAYGLIENDETAHTHLNAFRCKVAKPQHAELNWDDQKKDDPNTRLLRLTLLGWMLAGEDDTTTNEAIKRFETATSIDTINAEHRGMILGTLIKSEPRKYMKNLIHAYKDTTNPEIQMAISSGLSSIKDKALSKQLISEALGDQKAGFVRSQDIFRWFAYLMRNRHTRANAWQWLADNWDRLYAEFSESKSLDYFVVYAAGPLNTKEWQTKFETFFEPKSDIVALKRNIKIAQAEIKARVDWRNRDEAKVKAFLNSPSSK